MAELIPTCGAWNESEFGAVKRTFLVSIGVRKSIHLVSMQEIGLERGKGCPWAGIGELYR